MAVDDALSVHPTQAVFSSGLDLATITAGRVVEARVVSLVDSQAVLAGRFGTLQVDLGSARAAVGDVLRFEVQTVPGGDGKSGLTLALVGATTSTAASATTPPAIDAPARALAEAVGRAAATQSGLAPLFSSLAGLAAAPSGTIPEPVRSLVDQLMGARLAADGAPTAADVARGFQGSGLFLEQRLAKTGGVAPSQDLKAGLLALKDALGRWVGTASAPGTTASATSAATAATATPGATSSPATATPAAGPTTPGGRAAAQAYGGGPRGPDRPDMATPPDLSPRVATAAYGAPRVAVTIVQPSAQAAAASGATVQSPTSANAATPTPTTTATPAEATTPPAPTAAQPPATTPPNAPGTPRPATTALPGAPLPAAPTNAAAVDPQAARPDAPVAIPPSTTPPAGPPVTPPGPGLPTAPLGTRLPTEPPLATALPAPAALAGGDAASVAATVAGAEERGRADRATRPPPPRRGSAPRGQAALPAETAEGDLTPLARRALERTDGALQRILLEQYAALDRHDDAAAPASAPPRHGEWTAEIPIATRDGTAVLQMTVERDRSGRGATPEARSGDWRVRFALDVEPVGPVTAQIGLAGERLSIGLWIERPEVAVQMGDAIGQLRGALEAAAIPVEAIHVATGRPSEAARTPASGRFIDVSL